MGKKIQLSLISLIVVFVFLFTVFELTFSEKITKDKTQLLNAKVSGEIKTTNYNFRWIATHKKNEIVVGLLDNNILYNYKVPNEDSGALYFYDPKKGKKELISMHGEHSNIDSIISKAKNKVLLHYDYSFSALELFNFVNTKIQNRDHEFDYINKTREIKNKIELYDPQSGNFEKIFEYKLMGRVLEGPTNYVADNFHGLGWSKNGDYIVYCIEYDIGNLTFSIFDVNNKISKEYVITDTNKPLDNLYDLNISNDGKKIWLRALNNDDINKQEVLQYVLSENKMSPKLIATNVNTFKISPDNQFILYTKYENKLERNITKLICLNLSSGKENIIAENVLGYDFSYSNKQIAYISKHGEGAKLFVADYDNLSKEKTYIHTFPTLSGVECIDFGENNTSLLISFYTKDKDLSYQYKTCIVDLN